MPFAVLLITIVATLGTLESWPAFRGPHSNGHAPVQQMPRLNWDESTNIRWKAPIPGLGWSSPTIADGRVWLTTAKDDGRSLHLLEIGLTDGKIIKDIAVFPENKPTSIHQKNSHASPTPIVDGNRVFVHFGTYGTACVSTDGEVKWRNRDLIYNHRHGPGGSPILVRDQLVINCDGTDKQFVVSLDAETGTIRWKADRQGPMAYSTPLWIHEDGLDQIVSTGGNQVVAYRPDNGEVIWRMRYVGYSCVPQPVYGHGLVFVCSSYDTPYLYAIRPTGTGDVTDSHVAWKMSKGAPHNPTPLLVGDELYVVSDRGILSCLDAKTGESHWQQRLGGNFSASPLLVGGVILFLNEEGIATIVEPNKKKFVEKGINKLPGRTLATPAVADGALFLRTDTTLYCIEGR